MKVDDVRDFLKGYADAWLAGDLDAVAAHHALPLILAMHGRTSFLETDDELHASLAEQQAAFDAAGGAAGFDPYEITPLPDHAARVRARWSLKNGEPREPANTLAADDDGVVAIVAIEPEG